MFELILPPSCHESFIVAAVRFASRPVAVNIRPDRLLLQGLEAGPLSLSLVRGVFLPYEQNLLEGLFRRYFRCFDAAQRRRVLELAQALIAEEPSRGRVYSGRRREERLAALLAGELINGPVDILGFFRFRLPDHRDYLRYILELAADQLLAEEEQQEYWQLLRDSSQPEKRGDALHLFFCPGRRFRLWRENNGAAQDMEGGVYSCDSLLSALICMRPARLTVHDAHLAPEPLPELLEQIFDNRLIQA